MKLSDYVIQFISKIGVDHIFLLPGGGSMHLVDSVGKNKEITPVCFLHEQAAAIAADGYAQYRNDIGVALVTTGPGGTNTITAVAASWIDSTPVMIISGQVKRSDLMHGKGVRQMGVQEVDIVSIVKPITKYSVTITEPEAVRYHLEKALYFAKSGRPGPVWIDIPLDVQSYPIEEKKLKGFKPKKKKRSALESAVKKCIEMLNESKKPVILAGRGIRLANAEAYFLKFIEKTNIPVLLTWRLLDIIPEDHKLNFGRPGSVAPRYSNFILQSADLLISIGARLDLAQVGYNYRNFAKNAKKVIVDIDEAEIRKIDTKIDLPIVSDAKDFLIEFLKRSSLVKDIDRKEWIERCRKWKEKYPVILPEYKKEKGYVNTYVLIDILSDILTEEDIIVPGSSGSCSEITCQVFRIKKGQRLINSPGLGSMGFGLPQSIGVCLASNKKKRTICIIGDGGLQHNIQELETLRRLNLPIKIFVLNNSGYAAIRNTQKRFFGRFVCCDPESGLTTPDLKKIANAYSLRYFQIKNQRRLEKKIMDVIETEGPVMCEVMIDPDLQIQPRISSTVMPDGRIVSKPLEDLWPFLDSKEV